MIRNKRLLVVLCLAVLALLVGGIWGISVLKSRAEKSALKLGTVTYLNKQYGFSLDLPASWQGYTALREFWQGTTASPKGGEVATEQGPEIILRDPRWSEVAPRQDLPILIFTASQWAALQQDKFHVGAAPIGPTELGRNDSYVFALPARYNYAFPPGYEEVDALVRSSPLKGF